MNLGREYDSGPVSLALHSAASLPGASAPSPVPRHSLCIIWCISKKGAVSYCFDPILYCPPLAALFDDRREEFSRVGSKG